MPLPFRASVCGHHLDETKPGFDVILSERVVQQQVAKLFPIGIPLLEGWDKEMDTCELPIV
jgi:hypothetical protein